MPEKKIDNTDDQMLNPQIATVKIGTRRLRNLTIYPLAMADEIKLTDVVTQALGQVEDKQDIAVIAFIVDLIKQNMGRILTMATDDDGDNILKELSNMQATEIAGIIYEVNFGGPAKNAKSLFDGIAKLFRLERPSLPSVNDIMDTDLNTSKGEDSQTEE